MFDVSCDLDPKNRGTSQPIFHFARVSGGLNSDNINKCYDDVPCYCLLL